MKNFSPDFFDPPPEVTKKYRPEKDLLEDILNRYSPTELAEILLKHRQDQEKYGGMFINLSFPDTSISTSFDDEKLGPIVK